MHPAPRLVSYSERTGNQWDTDDFTEFYDSGPENLFRRLVDVAASIIVVVCKNGCCWMRPLGGCVLTSVPTSVATTPSSVVTHVFFVVENIYKKIQFQVVVVVVAVQTSKQGHLRFRTSRDAFFRRRAQHW